MRAYLNPRVAPRTWRLAWSATHAALRLTRIALFLTARQPWSWWSLLGIAAVGPCILALAPLAISGSTASGKGALASLLFLAFVVGVCWGLHATAQVGWAECQVSRSSRLLAQFAILVSFGGAFGVCAAGATSAFGHESAARLATVSSLALLSLASGALLLRQLVGERALVAPMLLAAFWIAPAVSGSRGVVGRVLHSALNVHAHLRWAYESSETPRVTWLAIAPPVAFLLLAALVSRSTRP